MFFKFIKVCNKLIGFRILRSLIKSLFPKLLITAHNQHEN